MKQSRLISLPWETDPSERYIPGLLFDIPTHYTSEQLSELKSLLSNAVIELLSPGSGSGMPVSTKLKNPSLTPSYFLRSEGVWTDFLPSYRYGLKSSMLPLAVLTTW